jgi:DNA processing protein
VRARDPFSILREGRPEAAEPLWRQQRLFDAEPAPMAGASAGELDLASREAPSTMRARILDLLGPSPISIDELVRAAEASISDVRIVLLELDLAGRLEHSGGARVALTVPQGRD